MLGEVDVLQIGQVQVAALNGGGHGAVGTDGEDIQAVVAASDGVTDGGLSHAVVGIIHEGQLHAQVGLHGQVALVDGVGDDAVTQLLADQLIVAAGFLDVEDGDFVILIVQLLGKLADVVHVLSLGLALGLGNGVRGVGVVVARAAGGHRQEHESRQAQGQQLFQGRSHRKDLLIKYVQNYYTIVPRESQEKRR